MPALLRDHEFRTFYAPSDEPLENFYIPALTASIQYDRSAGFFSSTALAVAASGVAGLVRNGGRMRLLVGADLSGEDVDAIRHGYDLKDRVRERMELRLVDVEDQLLKDRLAVLAWMVAEGTLEIRVVLPTDEYGLHIPASESADYYHPKQGIFTDKEGNQVAFSGSVNESETGWKNNYETFLVFKSWEPSPHLGQIALDFEHLWEGKEKDWIALDIPEAVRQKLLKYKPALLPDIDRVSEVPEEIAFGQLPTPQELGRERLVFATHPIWRMPRA